MIFCICAAFFGAMSIFAFFASSFSSGSFHALMKASRRAFSRSAGTPGGAVKDLLTL